MVRLTHLTILEIRNSRPIKEGIKDAAGWHGDNGHRSLYRHLARNEGNGPLTSIGVLMVISARLKKDIWDLIEIYNEE